MFKSVFAKYVITFMALLLVSFLLLLFIVNSVVSHDLLQSERDRIVRVSKACSDNLSELYEQSNETDFGNFLRADVPGNESFSYIERLITAIITDHPDMTVYVTDASGGFIFCTGKALEATPDMGTPLFSDEELTALRDEAQAVGTEQDASLSSEGSDTELQPLLRGKFITSKTWTANGQNLAYVEAIRQGNGCTMGYVMITSTVETAGNTVSTTLRSMIIAAMWIILAALIAIYFITEHVIAPLRDMSKAAKRMAVGQFDVRVPVHGKDEVAELAVAFNQMSQALDNLERMRNSFVANVSHDLRTPMTTIAGFIDGILDGVIPPEQTEHYLKVVSDEVRRLSRLVTALLDISRLQAGDRKFDMKPFDVCEMGRQILISFEQKINDKQLDVEFLCDDDRMFVLADRDAIHQILYNICDNAVKFATERGKLRMSFTWSSGDGSRRRKAVVKVYNEGQGIPPEDIPFVFERFYKSDKSRGLDKSGVGLGMFISKTIIDAHGETITVDSEYGRSCEFTFTLAKTEPPASKGRTAHP